MPKKIDIEKITPDGFIEVNKIDILSNGANSKLLIKIEDISLIEFNGVCTEITLNFGKIVKVMGTVEYIKKSILIAQWQLKGEDFEFTPVKKTAKSTFLLWLAYQPKVSSTLAKALRVAEEITGIKYIEEITKTDFLKINGAGKQTWAEFIKLRGY